MEKGNEKSGELGVVGWQQVIEILLVFCTNSSIWAWRMDVENNQGR